MVSGFHRWFQRQFRNPASPFATRGLPRVSFPAFNRYYGDAKTASVLLLHLRFSLGARYLGSLSVFFTRRPKVRRRAWILFYRFDPLRSSFPLKTGGSPSFPEDPSAALRCSSTPGGLPRQTFAALPCCPRFANHEGSPVQFSFEALSHRFAARCLRLKASFLCASQGSLVVVGQTFPRGLFPAGSW